MWGRCYECKDIGNVHPLVSTSPKGLRFNYGVRCLKDREELRRKLERAGHTNIHVPKEA